MKIKGYKAFNKDMTCQGKQYEVGKTYKKEEAKICEKGMHFCINPFDVLTYYNLVDSEFCKVESSGKTDKSNEDSKVATTKLRIITKLGLKGYINVCVDFLLKECKPTKKTSGYGAKIGSSGDGAQIGSSGNGAKIGSSGNWAQIGSSGDWAQIGSSGNGAQIGSSGDEAKIELDGKNSVGMCAGMDCMAKGKKGNWITLAEWRQRKNGTWYPYHVASTKIDGKRIKEDTWYKLKNKKFMEIKQAGAK